MQVYCGLLQTQEHARIHAVRSISWDAELLPAGSARQRWTLIFMLREELQALRKIFKSQ